MKKLLGSLLSFSLILLTFKLTFNKQSAFRFKLEINLNTDYLFFVYRVSSMST